MKLDVRDTGAADSLTGCDITIVEFIAKLVKPIFDLYLNLVHVYYIHDCHFRTWDNVRVNNLYPPFGSSSLRMRRAGRTLFVRPVRIPATSW